METILLSSIHPEFPGCGRQCSGFLSRWSKGVLMKAILASALAVILALAALPSHAKAPDPTYDQTRDWVVATIADSAGYTADSAVVTYKDVTMDSCQLRFTTMTTTRTGDTDSASFTVSLDSLNTVLWGAANEPARGYVLFTTATPISFSKQTVARFTARQPQATTTLTSVAALEFGRPGFDGAETASHMRAALLHASNLCKVQLAAK